MCFLYTSIVIHDKGTISLSLSRTPIFLKKEQTNKPKLKTGTASGFLGLFLPTNQNEQTGGCARFWFVHPKIKGTNTNPPDDFRDYFLTNSRKPLQISTTFTMNFS